MKTFKFSLVLRTRENTDVSLHSMTIFMVFTEKELISSIYSTLFQRYVPTENVYRCIYMYWRILRILT